MAIYRGTGETGTGSESDFAQLVQDAEDAAAAAALSEDNAAESASDAAASAIAAAAAAEGVADDAAAAAASAASAATSATNAANSATSASTSATNASNSASSAATSATSATSSAIAAAASATAADISEANAATSETNAASSASNAATSATNAATSATSAASSATTATTQATNASNSASAAATSTTNASNSATSASTSATNAASSATSATNSATAASTSATNAASSATSAAASATAAALSESNAATSATNASNSASSASTSATNASNSASAASTSASNAATSETNAANSATAAAASYDNFDDRYLGSKATDPTLDNDGNALLTGALYWNSTSSVMKAYSGSAWVTAYAPSGSYALSGANTDITSMSGITGGITTPDFVTFDTTPETTPTAAGSLYWDSADGNQTLSLIMAGGDVTQQIGQEQYYRIKASSAITNGQVVMFTGSVGASGALTGAPATGLTAATASYVMGIATQDIAHNGWGYVTSFGLVRDLNTSAYTDGAILYLDPTVAGGLTATVPTAPAPKVQVCAVTHAATNGSLFVRPSFGGTLGQYEGDVSVTSPATGDVLIRNSSGVWENKAQSNIAAGSASTATTATTATNQSGGTVAATTGSFSGNVTLSGGTANGVAYLNGSKVLTTGSALTFDGTNFATTGALRSVASSAQLQLVGGTNTATVTSFDILQAGVDAYVFNRANGPLIFGVNNAGQMHLTSTGLGVGTSSPVAKLSVSNSGANGFEVIPGYSAGAETRLNSFNRTSSAYTNIGTDALAHYWLASGSEQMRLTSTGLGIGTSSIVSKLAIGGYSSANQAPDIYITRSSSGTSIQTGPNITFADGTVTNTTSLQVTQGRFGVWNYGGGVWAERMSIDSSGNLGLGVTPSAWGGSYGVIQGLNQYSISTDGLSSNTFDLASNAYRISAGSWKYLATSSATNYRQSAGQHTWYTATSGTAGAAISFTQAMTLNASGNLGIGTSSPGVKLDVDGTVRSTNFIANSGGYTLYNNSDNTNYYYIQNVGATGSGNPVLSFIQGGVSERMRIDSSGNLLVGTTSVGPVNANAITLEPTNSRIRVAHSSTANATPYVQFDYNGAAIGSITQATTSTVAYNTSSDYRLKENVQPMQNALDVVAQLNPVTYNWKADGSDGQGFIAHELQAVVPDCVTGEKDAVDADGKPVYQGIDTSFLVATLTKAIQEQQEQINQLKAEVAALKGA